MEGAKNNFGEVKKLLLEALSIMEETNVELMNRISNLESRAVELENRVKELEHNKAVSADDNTETGTYGAAGLIMEEESEVETELMKEQDVMGEQCGLKEPDMLIEQSVIAGPEELEESEELEEPEKQEELNEPVALNGLVELNVPEEPDELDEPEELEDLEALEELNAPMELNEPEDQNDMNEPETLQDLEADSGLEQDDIIGIPEESLGNWTDEIVAGNGAVEMVKMVNDMAKPDWYDWEVDYPAAYVEDVYAAISFNDRYEFVKELFNVSGSLDEAEMLFKETLDVINELDNFKKVVAYIRERFPQWDEQSDEVYRFYMAVRRKFNRPQAN